LSDPTDPIWTYDGLRDLKALVNSEGLELEALENFAPAQWYDVLLDGPRRAQQMERLKQLIRDLGRVGIPIMGYYFSVAGVWGQAPGPNARGNAMSVGFDDPAQPPIPAGMVWNMVYDTAQFDPEHPSQVLAPVSDQEIQQRFRAFINQSTLAELAEVRRRAPVDPPMPVLSSAHRPSYTPERYAAIPDANPSPANTLSCAWARWPRWPRATFTAWWKGQPMGASATSTSVMCGQGAIIAKSLWTKATRI
jgi:mannonate dehydratase